MRVRVRFRFNSDTGEVEVFEVDDARVGPPDFDHDERHDAASLEVARVVDPHPTVTEVAPNSTTRVSAEPEQAAPDPARPSTETRLRD